MDIPRIETERLILRAFREDDIESVAEMYADSDVARFITHDGKPQDREYSWRTMTNLMGHWLLRGYGMWAVEEKASASPIGYVGPYYPETWPGQEIGWTIAKPCWGKGFATEAALASLTYVRDVLRWPYVIHLIDPQNTRSAVVAERIGSRRDGEWIRNGRPLQIYGQRLSATQNHSRR